MIDDEGNVRTNHKKDSGVLINTSDPNKEIVLFDSIIYHIDKLELGKYIALIELASKGRIDSVIQSRADFGSTGFNCFLYNEKKNSYTSILLSLMSDNLDKINVDSNAIKIDNWLKDIHIRIYSN